MDNNCLAYEKQLYCHACEDGYYLGRTLKDYSQCQRNPQKGEKAFIENCLEYEGEYHTCAKCVAHLTYYLKTNSCVDASTLYENCQNVLFDEVLQENICTQCQEGFHFNKFKKGCLPDPLLGQKEYIQNCARYYDFGTYGTGRYVVPDYICEQCEQGYKYDRKSKQCYEWNPVEYCGLYEIIEGVLQCTRCVDGLYLFNREQCAFCNYEYQEQSYELNTSIFNRINKFLEKNFE